MTRRLHPGGICVRLNASRGFKQKKTRRDYCLVACPEMLLGSIDDRPHAFLDSVILQSEAVDPGESLRLLDISIDEPMRLLIPNLAKVGRSLVPTLQRVVIKMASFLLADRLLSERIRPAIDHAVLIVHRNPHVAAHFRLLGS
jgi:hypothetical protein